MNIYCRTKSLYCECDWRAITNAQEEVYNCCYDESTKFLFKFKFPAYLRMFSPNSQKHITKFEYFNNFYCEFCATFCKIEENPFVDDAVVYKIYIKQDTLYHFPTFCVNCSLLLTQIN